MKLVICAGPATTGKTAVLGHIVRRLLTRDARVAFLKIDVQYAEEDEWFAREFGLPARKVYSGELCPDHCNVMVLGDALEWAGRERCGILMVETAGLCLRCSPYVDGGLGLVVLEATERHQSPAQGGAHAFPRGHRGGHQGGPRFPGRARGVPRPHSGGRAAVRIREVNGLLGIGIDPLVEHVLATPEAGPNLLLRGNPPLGTCTICVGKKEVGWQSHFGVVRPLENQTFYRGE